MFWFILILNDCIHRKDGILILSGGLMAHNLQDRRCFSIDTATELHKSFDNAIHEAIQIPEVRQRPVSE